MLCERCGKTVFKYTVCNSCNRKICNDCLKSSKRITKTEKAFICKDCWSDMAKRRKYKQKKKEAPAARQYDDRFERFSRGRPGRGRPGGRR